MKRILLAGMSGTGKSTLIRELALRGYRAIDMDNDGWSHWIDMRTGEPAPPPAAGEDLWGSLDWVWREDRLQELLGSADEDELFVTGTSPDQAKFYLQFDHIALLTAPADVIVERLATRTENPYGTTPRSLARVLEHLQTIEPRFRARAGHVIDKTAPLEEIVERVLLLGYISAPSTPRQAVRYRPPISRPLQPLTVSSPRFYVSPDSKLGDL